MKNVSRAIFRGRFPMLGIGFAILLIAFATFGEFSLVEGHLRGSSAAPRELMVQTIGAVPGSQMNVMNILVDAMGDEVEYGFVVTYDQSVLSLPASPIGVGNAGAATRSCNTSTAGVINCSVGSFPEYPPPERGTDPSLHEIRPANDQILITIAFDVAPGAAFGTYPVRFRQCPGGPPCPLNSPPNASNDRAQLVTITSVDGSIVIGNSAAGVTVSGRVIADKRPVRGAVVSMTDDQGRIVRTRSNARGFYRFENVAAGESYVMAVRAKRYRFSPRTVTVNDDLTDIDFIAER